MNPSARVYLLASMHDQRRDRPTLYGRRLAIWFAEMVCQWLLIAGLPMVSFDYSRGLPTFEMKIIVVGTAFFMVASGYVMTTAVVGVFCRGKSLWLYPAVAVLLFVLHERFFFTVVWRTPFHIDLLVLGGCVVFLSTLGGNWLLRRWPRAPLGDGNVTYPPLRRASLKQRFAGQEKGSDTECAQPELAKKRVLD